MSLKKSNFKAPPTDAIKRAASAASAPQPPKDSPNGSKAFQDTFRVGSGQVATPGRKRTKMTISLDPKFVHVLKTQLSRLSLEHDVKVSASDIMMVAVARFFDEVPREDQLRIIERHR